MGFGAERANLMGEAPVEMPYAATNNTESTAAASDSGESSAQNVDLNQRSQNAKTQLISEILNFDNERQQVESAAEDHKTENEQQTSQFAVRDPVKVGKVTKYTVTGVDSSGQWEQ